MTVKEAVLEASAAIARRDAEVLLLHGLGRTRAWLLSHPETELASAELVTFRDNVSRRAQHWPLQYLTGRQEFYGLDLEVGPGVLIPRPETELLVEAVLEWAGPLSGASEPLRIADVGTGSGAIALALATHLPRATVLALDLSLETRPIVERNAARLGLTDRVQFQQSDLLRAVRTEAIGRALDVVVSNPPYVPLEDAPTLEPQVREFEPSLALFADEGGLAVYRRLIPEAWVALRPGGLLAMEFGFGQKQALAQLLEAWDSVRCLDDYAGIPRHVLAVRPAR